MEDQIITRLPSIASLMSPPESKALDDFRHTPATSPAISHLQDFPSKAFSPSMHSHDKPRTLPSPPISPYNDRHSHQEQEPRGHKRKASDRKDPVLYAESEVGSAYEEPLFPPEHAVNTEELITRHMAMHMTQFKNKLNQPTREEYRLAIACVPNIGAQYNRDPMAYMRQQQEEQENEYRQAKRICQRPGQKAPIAILPAPKAGKRAIKPSAPKPVAQRVKRTPKASPISKLMNFPPKGRSATPDSKGAVVKRDDVDFDALPDFSPPLTTLDGRHNVFKPEWPSNNLLNLENDPDRDRLHKEELVLASKLRLNCAKYICCKRRLFEARLNALRIGKEFRKTDAQQSCAVDVNKASRLWTCYDKAGWLDKKYVEQYL